jgi:hypothetical protein
MTTITISDRGAALVAMDMELDRLDLEKETLEVKLENNKARAMIIRKAMIIILEEGKYELQL